MPKMLPKGRNADGDQAVFSFIFNLNSGISIQENLGACSVTVIAIGNRLKYANSNSERDCLHFT